MMRLLFFLFAPCLVINAQDIEWAVSKILEDYSHESDDMEQVDDECLENLYDLAQQPLDLNAASPKDLLRLFWLSEFQVISILNYRKENGAFLSIQELNYVYGFTEEEVALLKPFVSIRNVGGDSPKMYQAQRTGEILLRMQHPILKSKGYAIEDTILQRPHYLGSALKSYLRVSSKLNEKWAIGLLGEKDAGEAFMFKNTQYGFDHLSAYLQYQGKGLIRKLIVGHFNYYAGQGLLSWGAYASANESDLSNLKRRKRGLYKTTSSNEYWFMQGVGSEFSIGPFQLINFLSVKSIDGSLIDADTAQSILSLAHTGLHRSSSEMAKKNAVQEIIVGNSLVLGRPELTIGINQLLVNYEHEFAEKERLYYLLAQGKRRRVGHSIDFQILKQMFQLYGELSFTNCMALQLGINLMPASKITLAAQYRNYQAGSWMPYSNPWSKGTNNSGEEGFIFGVDFKLPKGGFLKSSYDVYTIPWLKYQSIAPTKGYALNAEIQLRPFPKLRFHSTFRSFIGEEKALAPDSKRFISVKQVKNQLRMHWEYQLSDSWCFSKRFEMTWDRAGKALGNRGNLAFLDIKYANLTGKFQIYGRYTIFSIPNYDLRIYAYENDLRYMFSVPAFSGIGESFYIVLNHKLGSIMQLGMKYRITKYHDRSEVGYGWDAIVGDTKMDIRFQLICRWR